MTKTKKILRQEIFDALAKDDAERAWNLVVENITGDEGECIPNVELTANLVPRTLSWQVPSVVQAFAMTFHGYKWRREDGRDDFMILDLTEPDRGYPFASAMSLTQLRASLFSLQRAYQDSDGEPDPRLVARICDEIRLRLSGGGTRHNSDN